MWYTDIHADRTFIHINKPKIKSEKEVKTDGDGDNNLKMAVELDVSSEGGEQRTNPAWATQQDAASQQTTITAELTLLSTPSVLL